MAITKQECTNLLHDQFVSSFSQIENPGKLMTDSWWENNMECLSYFDNSVVAVKDILNWWMKTEKEWAVKIIKEELKPEKTDSNFMAAVESLSWNNINFDNPLSLLQTIWLIGKWVLVWFFLIILFGLFMRMLKAY